MIGIFETKSTAHKTSCIICGKLIEKGKCGLRIRYFAGCWIKSKWACAKCLDKGLRKYRRKGTIRIVVEGGLVVDVSNLPRGWEYEIRDIDHEKRQ